MTTKPAAVIDRITLIVSDLGRAEEDYVATLGCRVEYRVLMGIGSWWKSAQRLRRVPQPAPRRRGSKTRRPG
jgi:hypothetical protein